MLRLGFLKTRCWRLACHTGCTDLTEHIWARLYWLIWCPCGSLPRQDVVQGRCLAARSVAFLHRLGSLKVEFAKSRCCVACGVYRQSLCSFSWHAKYRPSVNRGGGTCVWPV